MGERKVLNKYYPPDFDPSNIPRRRQPKNQQINVRMMLPMTIRCSTCGNYISKGTKFNMWKEDCVGETYLEIQILRFYFKCNGDLSAELTMKTDPQNSEYTMESGFESCRAKDKAVENAKSKRDAEELGDSMKALENSTLDTKQEMEIMAALDEMISMRARRAGVGTTKMLEALNKTRALKEGDLAEEDETVLGCVVFQNSSNFVRRLDDDEFAKDVENYNFEAEQLQQERKRRKGESLEHVPEAKANYNLMRAPFQKTPQPLTFSIKPKGSTGSLKRLKGSPIYSKFRHLLGFRPLTDTSETLSVGPIRSGFDLG